MKLALGSDHAGVDLRRFLADALKPLHFIMDCGCDGTTSVDYPEYAAAVANAVRDQGADFGICICGTGIGISIAANKQPLMRAALCHTEYEARMARAHNDANILCLGARVIGQDVAWSITQAFLATAFEGGRHQRRVNQLIALDQNRSTI
jgi:ribose 5-phosphate isomerase B